MKFIFDVLHLQLAVGLLGRGPKSRRRRTGTEGLFICSSTSFRVSGVSSGLFVLSSGQTKKEGVEDHRGVFMGQASVLSAHIPSATA